MWGLETVQNIFGFQGGVEWQEGQKEDFSEGDDGRSEGGEAAAEADGEEGAEEEVKKGEATDKEEAFLKKEQKK